MILIYMLRLRYEYYTSQFAHYACSLKTYIYPMCSHYDCQKQVSVISGCIAADCG